MIPPTPLAAREGFKAPGTDDFIWPAVAHLHVFGIDISINRTVLLIFGVTALLTIVLLAAFARPKVVPRGLQNVMEATVDFVRHQIVDPVMGSAGEPFLPYLFTLFIFIFFCNVLEIIPGINFPVTSRLWGVPVVLAAFSWFIYMGAGIKSQGAGHYFRNVLLPPGVPLVLMPIIIPIELVSNIVVRPCTLAIRLLANMVAGHLMLTVFFLGTDYLLTRQLTFGFGVVAGLMSVALVGFELFVAGLQAFIFTTLTAVYIAGSLEPAH